MPAISLHGARGAKLENIRISNLDVGVHTTDSDFSANGVVFDNVTRPWDVNGGSQAQVENSSVLNDPSINGNNSPHRGGGNAFSGWGRNGPPLPSQCPHCKTIFPSRNFDFGTARFLAKNNVETCRECKRDGAKLADGLFDLTGEAARIISGSNLTHAMLAAINEAAKDHANDSIDDDEFIHRLENIDFGLGEIARKISSGGSNALAWFGIALTIMGNIISYLSLVEAQKTTPSTLEGTVIAREALRVQNAPNPSEELLRTATGQLSEIKIVLKELVKGYGPTNVEQPSAEKSKAEPPAETGSVNLQAERKPKSRDVKRKARKEHRSKFGRMKQCKPHT